MNIPFLVLNLQYPWIITVKIDRIPMSFSQSFGLVPISLALAWNPFFITQTRIILITVPETAVTMAKSLGISLQQSSPPSSRMLASSMPQTAYLQSTFIQYKQFRECGKWVPHPRWGTSTYHSPMNSISVEWASGDRCSYRYGSHINNHLSVSRDTRLISRTFFRLGFSRRFTSFRISCLRVLSKLKVQVCRPSEADFICFLSSRMRRRSRRDSRTSRSLLIICSFSDRIQGQQVRGADSGASLSKGFR